MSRPITSRKAAIAYNDIDALAQHVHGFDARRYFDQQGEVETAEAMGRWPLLAAVMGLRPRAMPRESAGPDGGKPDGRGTV